MVRLLIIIPCYNEKENIIAVVESIDSSCSKIGVICDYIVINDGSTDETEEILNKYGCLHLRLPDNLGIGGAVQAGYLYAAENDYDYAVQLDGDGQHDPAYIAQMLQTMQESGADMVIGSRYLQKQGFQSSSARRLGNSIINGFLGWTCHVKVTDSTSGFRLCNRRLIAHFAGHYAQDYPEPEAIADAAVHGFRIAECPVIMRERQGGTSSINLKKSAYYMIKVLLAILIQKMAGEKDRT